MRALELIDKAIAHCEKLRPTETGHGVTLALLREIKEEIESLQKEVRRLKGELDTRGG